MSPFDFEITVFRLYNHVWSYAIQATCRKYGTAIRFKSPAAAFRAAMKRIEKENIPLAIQEEAEQEG